MVSRWLRWVLAVLATATAAVVLLAWSAGLGLAAALALGALPCLLINSSVLAVTYAYARRYACRPPPALAASGWRAGQAVALEWLATLVLFAVIQPFERLWMGRERPGGGSAAPPLLLIHGYLCNRGVWWWLRRGLRAQGRAVATVDLEPPLGGIDGYVAILDARIRALLAETGAAQVVLVGHSMGGLAARAYLRRHGGDKVAKLITLGTPHHGSRLARLGLGRNAREMAPESAWIRDLAETPPPIPVLSVWSLRDNYVAPQDSSRLAGAEEVVLPTIGHLAMAFSPRILGILLEAAAAPPGPAKARGETGVRTRHG